jgi:hypothetical protein
MALRKPPKEVSVPYVKRPLNWLVLIGRRRMNITPWVCGKPDLKYFKKYNNGC